MKDKTLVYITFILGVVNLMHSIYFDKWEFGIIGALILLVAFCMLFYTFNKEIKKEEGKIIKMKDKIFQYGAFIFGMGSLMFGIFLNKWMFGVIGVLALIFIVGLDVYNLKKETKKKDTTAIKMKDKKYKILVYGVSLVGIASLMFGIFLNKWMFGVIGVLALIFIVGLDVYNLKKETNLLNIKG